MNPLDQQKERDKRIYSKLNLDNLPYKLNYEHFKDLGASISLFIYHINNFHSRSKPLTWCFSNIKRTKIFMQIFHANEMGREIYKEEIAKLVSEYSYKTIAKIIDEGFMKGYYVPLKPDGDPGTDAKVKNIRPSEELIIDFLNLGVEIIHVLELFKKKMKL